MRCKCWNGFTQENPKFSLFRSFSATPEWSVTLPDAYTAYIWDKRDSDRVSNFTTDENVMYSEVNTKIGSVLLDGWIAIPEYLWASWQQTWLPRDGSWNADWSESCIYFTHKIKIYAKSFSDRTNKKAIEEHVPVSGYGNSLLGVVRSESSWLSVIY